MEGVYVCVVDQCAYGLRVEDGLNRKTTQFLTNDKHIAEQLQRRCSGDHDHEPLIGGKAVLAAEYPPELCRCIVKGLKRSLRARDQCALRFNTEEIAVFVEGNAEIDEDLLDEPEEMLSDEAEGAGRERLRASEVQPISDDDKAKVTRMHVNLGHPLRDSFVRFLRAGRVREDVVQ